MIFFDDASENLVWFQNNLLHSGSFLITYKCGILKSVIVWTWLKIIRRWKKSKIKIISIKNICILNRRSSHYLNKHFLLLQLNRHNCFSQLFLLLLQYLHLQTSVQSSPLSKNTHVFGCIHCMSLVRNFNTCNIQYKFSFLMLKISYRSWNYVLIN